MQVHGWHGSGWQKALARATCRWLLDDAGCPSPGNCVCHRTVSLALYSLSFLKFVFTSSSQQHSNKWNDTKNGVEHTKITCPSVNLLYWHPTLLSPNQNAELGPPFEVHRPLKTAAPNRTQWVWFVPLHDPKETWPRPHPLAWCSSENDAMSFSLPGKHRGSSCVRYIDVTQTSVPGHWNNWKEKHMEKRGHRETWPCLLEAHWWFTIFRNNLLQCCSSFVSPQLLIAFISF